MGAQQKRPLRQLTPQEREELSQKAASVSERVTMVKKAKALLAVADGCTFTEAGRQVGMSYDGVSLILPLVGLFDGVKHPGFSSSS